VTKHSDLYKNVFEVVKNGKQTRASAVHFSLWPLESADRLRKTSTVTLKQLD